MAEGLSAAAAADSRGDAAAAAEEAKPHFTRDFQELDREGDVIWNASLVLLYHFKSKLPPDAFKGKKVLELGSGLGHLGFGIAKLGADVTLTEQKRCIPALHHNLAEMEKKEGTPSGTTRVLELEWGEEGWDNCELAREPEESRTFDIIISAELVYIEEVFEMLLWTWKRICKSHTVVWSIFLNRPFSWNFFVLLHDMDYFDVEQVDEGEGFDALGLEDCHMHVVRPKVALAGA
eukprot:TRINITY_DN103558_c0_g1_i1.p1 TRINITY_DN103558_c0_g1~~TRINITY_DN103558_c0_g1_i1.p1  ORF type:complete len:234 (-),score=55.39 TRINITY_DN103558_c0_g1_i1:59-760(-)